MSLYEAFRGLLVDGDTTPASTGPLENLFELRLPPKQVGAVDAAFVPIRGTPPTRVFGKKPVSDADAPWLEHDGGVLWHHTGVTLEFRSDEKEGAERPGEAYDKAVAARDLLQTLVGGSTEVVIDGHRIVRVAITSEPALYELDERGRVICVLLVEAWHVKER